MSYTKNLRNHRFIIIAALVSVLVFAGACVPLPVPPSGNEGEAAAQPSTPVEIEGRTPLTEAALNNATYELEDLGTIQLTDGEYRHQYGDGATMVNVVGLETAALGDLNGDGLDDAAVVLWWNGGGSGTFKYLAVMLDDGGTPRQVGIEFLGDRAQIEGLAIENGQIVVNTITHGPTDPMCCPTQHVTLTFGVADEKLSLLSEEATASPEAGGEEAPTSLPAGTNWTLVSYMNGSGAGVSVLPGTEITAEFSADQVTGKAGCNNYFASYQIENNGIVIGPVGATRMFCGEPDGIMDQENDYLAALGMAASYRIEGDTLMLVDEAGTTIATFRKAGAAATEPGLVGVVWTWQGFEDSAGLNDIVVPYPPSYRLEFGSDGMVSIKADCNRASGSYSVDGQRLTLVVGPTTLAECEPGSLYVTFLSRLGEVMAFVLDGDVLHLNLMADAGNMRFKRYHAVTGRIIVPQDVRVPARPMIEIKIVDMEGTQVGGARIDAAASGRPRFPMAFEAPYDTTAIQHDVTYLLTASMKDAEGNLTFQSRQPVPVLTQGNPTYHLNIYLQPIVS